MEFKYVLVVLMLAWPNSFCTSWRDQPASENRLAASWRKSWKCRSLIPAAPIGERPRRSCEMPCPRYGLPPLGLDALANDAEDALLFLSRRQVDSPVADFQRVEVLVAVTFEHERAQ